MNYLLQISIGPVQDFISAARRTRDLWFGSTLLSELSKAAALAVHDEGGRLIFPAPENPEKDLAPTTDPNNSINAANVILAEFLDASDETLKASAENARAKVLERFHDYADEVKNRFVEFLDVERWTAQVDDIIEFYYAYVPVKEKYSSARKNVAGLLAARKNIRDFKPSKFGGRMPKSSLDGLRESVFKFPMSENESAIFHRKARIKAGEYLDASGLIKRTGRMSSNPNDELFPSISRVAIDSWLRGRGKNFIHENWPGLEHYCEELADLGILNRVRDKTYNFFPYEGVVLYPSRHKAMLEGDDNDKAKKLLEDIADVMRQLPASDRPGEPYAALLCADGDRMGAALSGMNSADEHKNFSHELSKFALRARSKVQEYHGVCIYTGGDDVLAFLPLDTVLECSKALHDLFGSIMGQFGNPAPSLSVGISIAHSLEDIELHMQYAHEAEKIAKGDDRDGLAISVRSRGSSPVIIREQWQQDRGFNHVALMSVEKRLQFFAECFMKGLIPNKFPYELRTNAEIYEEWGDDETTSTAARDDVMRIFGRKDIKLSDEECAEIHDYIFTKIFGADDIRKLANEMIISQWLSFGIKQAGGN